MSQDHITGKYRLGPALLELGNAYLETHELRARSVVWADSLATRANEAVWVGVLSGDHVIVVHHAFRPEGAVQILEVGAALPWHTCALGKAIVAHSAGRERARAARRRTAGPHRRHDHRPGGAGRAAGPGARPSGYALEDGEAAIGDAGIAAPVLDRDGVVGAIGLVGPVERLLDGGPPGRVRGRRAGDRAAALPRTRCRPPGPAPLRRRSLLTAVAAVPLAPPSAPGRPVAQKSLLLARTARSG